MGKTEGVLGFRQDVTWNIEKIGKEMIAGDQIQEVTMGGDDSQPHMAGTTHRHSIVHFGGQLTLMTSNRLKDRQTAYLK